jgi:hypothetical protein
VPFNTRETVALETPARIETSSIVAIHRFLISRGVLQFITDIQGDMTSTPCKELSGSRFLQELCHGESDAVNAVCQYDKSLKIWNAKMGVEI